MSICYNINCHDCKEKLWVGQGNTIYTGVLAVEALSCFLHKHEGHHLSFDSDDKHNTFTDYEDE